MGIRTVRLTQRAEVIARREKDYRSLELHLDGSRNRSSRLVLGASKRLKTDEAVRELGQLLLDAHLDGASQPRFVIHGESYRLLPRLRHLSAEEALSVLQYASTAPRFIMESLETLGPEEFSKLGTVLTEAFNEHLGHGAFTHFARQGLAEPEALRRGLLAYHAVDIGGLSMFNLQLKDEREQAVFHIFETHLPSTVDYRAIREFEALKNKYRTHQPLSVHRNRDLVLATVLLEEHCGDSAPKLRRKWWQKMPQRLAAPPAPKFIQEQVEAYGIGRRLQAAMGDEGYEAYVDEWERYSSSADDVFLRAGLWVTSFVYWAIHRGDPQVPLYLLTALDVT